MKRASTLFTLLSPVLAAGWLAGCDGSEPATPDAAPDGMPDGMPDGPGPAVTITIVSDEPMFPAALVAFRDGVDGPWQQATMKSPTTFEAEVHGPYVLTIVCQDVARGLFSTFQLARTPDDERTLTQACDYTRPVRHVVSGNMAQPGRVQMDEGLQASNDPGWGFAFYVRSGTRDLVAISEDRIALRRGIAVSGDMYLTPPIDLDQEGAALADVAFTVTNGTPTEALTASVALQSPDSLDLSIYSGPLAAATVAPDAVLAATDVQTAAILGADGNVYRELRRPFRVGGDTTFTLPAPPDGIQWEEAGGDLAMRWGALPELDLFVIAARSGNATRSQNHYLTLSRRFVAATGITRGEIDTDIPGFRPEWRLDLGGMYYRNVTLQREVSGDTATITVAEQVDALGVARPAMAPPARVR